ncbi:Uncharacterized phage-encoded protein [Brevibacterium casei]|uniref:Uncharacterized phage-encoded protein n=1 Tax=Brevibacterium casei TaxID=33889 RepID=A0A449D7E3_9MICO|nr:phage antirepressor [Brevibacterium casei]VEW13514.1 Uncharacterized phage-encoded protein [Brevibacterium casei]
MKDLQIFNYQDTPVRTVLVDGEPWFVLADLAKVLGIAAPGRLASRLDEGVRQAHTLQTAGGPQNLTIVSEAGMYEVVIRSDKPEAVAFRRWITSEVLPSIRKTGGYGQPTPTGPELLAHAILEANKMLEAKDEQIAVLEPKARAWDHIVSSEASWSFNDAAKVLFEHKKIVVGEKRLFKRCVEWGYLYRDHKGRPHVYQRYLEQGLFAVKARTYTDQETGQVLESSAPQVRITGRGLDMLFTRLTEGQLVTA